MQSLSHICFSLSNILFQIKIFKFIILQNTYIVYENLNDKTFIYFGRSSLYQNTEATFKKGEILAKHNVM